MDDPCRVRPAWPADAPVIAALERRCFADPWSLQSFREALGTELSFGLVVECRGTLRSVLAFLGALPPSVAPTSVDLVRQEAGSARHRLTLAVYELEFQNVPSVSVAPVERRAAAGVRGDRIGG